MTTTHDVTDHCHQLDAECHQLDAEMVALFGEIQQQIQILTAQARGMLALYLRQKKLDGQWRVADNGRELRRADPQG